jgi:hypothetical protein
MMPTSFRDGTSHHSRPLLRPGSLERVMDGIGGVVDILVIDRPADAVVRASVAIRGIRVHDDEGNSQRFPRPNRSFGRVGRVDDSPLGSRAIRHHVVVEVDARHQRLIVGHPCNEGMTIVRVLEGERIKASGEFLALIISVDHPFFLNLIAWICVLGGEVDVDGTPDLVDECLGQEVASVIEVVDSPARIGWKTEGS